MDICIGYLEQGYNYRPLSRPLFYQNLYLIIKACYVWTYGIRIVVKAGWIVDCSQTAYLMANPTDPLYYSNEQI